MLGLILRSGGTLSTLLLLLIFIGVLFVGPLLVIGLSLLDRWLIRREWTKKQNTAESEVKAPLSTWEAELNNT